MTSTRQISCLVEKEGIFLKARPSAVKSLGGPFIRPVFLTMRNPKPQILIRKILVHSNILEWDKVVAVNHHLSQGAPHFILVLCSPNYLNEKANFAN